MIIRYRSRLGHSIERGCVGLLIQSVDVVGIVCRSWLVSATTILNPMHAGSNCTDNNNSYLRHVHRRQDKLQRDIQPHS